MQGGGPALPSRALPNEPVDPVQLSDVTRYPRRQKNLASATLTLKQEISLLFTPDPAANLQVQVA